MCDQATMDKVQEVVEEFVNDGKMFTAHDVTVEVRQRFDFQANHQDVRHAIGSLYREPFFQDYERNMGTNVPALVYHPMGTDVSLYDDNWLRTKYALGTGVTITPVTPIVFDPNPSHPSAFPATPSATNPSVSLPVTQIPTLVVFTVCSTNLEPDTRNRLCVPAKDIRAASYSVGGKLYLAQMSHNGEVLLSCSKGIEGQTFSVLGSYRVDKSGNVRIGLRALRRAGLYIWRHRFEVSRKNEVLRITNCK